MNIEPLPKKIFDKALSLGITKIHLNFSGGNDEGYVNVHLNGLSEHNNEFAQEIEEWVWETYDYSGAGDGNDYGDDVVYDLVNKTATSDSWYMCRTEGDSESGDLEIAEEIAE
jgi:hypothetical protein